MPATAAVDIICQRGAADKEAPEIVDNLITNEAVAVARGTAFLDENDYEKHLLRVQAPHKAGVIKDGLTIMVQDLNLGIDARFIVKGLKGQVTISGGKPSLKYDLDLENYTSPE